MSGHLTNPEARDYWMDVADELLDEKEQLRAANRRLWEALEEIANHDLHVDYADVELRNIARRVLGMKW